MEPTIRCPKCKTEIKLTEAMAGPLLEAERARLTADIADREGRLVEAQADLQLQVKRATGIEVERQRKEIERAANERIANAENVATRSFEEVEEMRRKLVDAQTAHAGAVRAKHEADEMKRELELTIAKRVVGETSAIRSQAVRDAEAVLGVKVTEREETIRNLQAQIETLRLEAQAGSARVQGEAQEIDLEGSLRRMFPEDEIEAVGKFADGADVIQRVVSFAPGTVVGVIVWESKRTKNWNHAWLAKLRQDQRDAKADLAVIVTRALPEDVETFALVDNVWVCAPRHATSLALVLRSSLAEVAVAKAVSSGQATKAEMLYRYLTGPQFKQRVQAVAEKLAELRDDLDRERKSLTRQWAKREQNLEVMATSLAGMYGDVQGLAGKAIGDLTAIALPELAGEEVKP